jgi:hypothetical protein
MLSMKAASEAKASAAVDENSADGNLSCRI